MIPIRKKREFANINNKSLIRRKELLMCKEMEYAKCIAVLRKMFKMQLLTEEEYNLVRNKLMDRYLIVRNGNLEAI